MEELQIRCTLKKALLLNSAAWLCFAVPVLARESRPFWFNPYDLPDHSDSKLVSKDYSLYPVFTRYYENLEIPADTPRSGAIAWKVDASSGRLLPWHYVGDPVSNQTLCTAFDATCLAGPVKINSAEEEWYRKNSLTANFHFDLVPRLEKSSSGYSAVQSARYYLPKEQQDAAVLRAIPKQILDYYPALFTAEELDSPTNFRVLDKNWINLHTIASLREDWITHFADSTFKPTKQDIFYIRDQQDSRCQKAIKPLSITTSMEGRIEGPRDPSIFKLIPTVPGAPDNFAMDFMAGSWSGKVGSITIEEMWSRVQGHEWFGVRKSTINDIVEIYLFNFRFSGRGQAGFVRKFAPDLDVANADKRMAVKDFNNYEKNKVIIQTDLGQFDYQLIDSGTLQTIVDGIKIELKRN